MRELVRYFEGMGSNKCQFTTLSHVFPSYIFQTVISVRGLFNSLNPSTDHTQGMNLRGFSVLA